MFTPYQYTTQVVAGRNLRVWVAVGQEEHDTGEVDVEVMTIPTSETVVKFVDVSIFVPLGNKSPELREEPPFVEVMRPGSQKEKNLENARKAGFELRKPPAIDLPGGPSGSRGPGGDDAVVGGMSEPRPMDADTFAILEEVQKEIAEAVTGF